MFKWFVKPFIDTYMIVAIDEIGQIEFPSTLRVFEAFGLFSFIVEAFFINIKQTGIGGSKELIKPIPNLITLFPMVPQNTDSPHLIIFLFSIKAMFIQILILIDGDVRISSRLIALSWVSACIANHYTFEVNC
jgi:hypothetical protein